MLSTIYKRRGKRTLVALLVIRFIPAFLFLIAVLIFQIAKPALSTSIEKLYGQSSELFLQSYSYVVGVGLLLFIVLAIILIVAAYVEYISFTYAIDDDAFKTQTGIIDIKEMSVLYRHIQNVDIDRPLVYRLMNMSRLVILTAAHQDNEHKDEHDETEVVIDMIDDTEAQTLQEELLNRSNVETVREVPPSPTPLHTS